MSHEKPLKVKNLLKKCDIDADEEEDGVGESETDDSLEMDVTSGAQVIGLSEEARRDIEKILRAEVDKCSEDTDLLAKNIERRLSQLFSLPWHCSLVQRGSLQITGCMGLVVTIGQHLVMVSTALPSELDCESYA